LALSFGVRKPALRSRRSRLCQLPRGLTARTLAAHASPRELPRGSGPAFAEAERRLRP
ncbi:hypothetical protein M9458_011839, partial [Cirrhinus mrigala]